MKEINTKAKELIKQKEKMKQKTLVSYDNYMSCALPPEVYEEMQNAIIEIILLHQDKATAYQWTMSELDDNKKTLYAKYPDTYKNNFDEELKKAKKITFEIYGDGDTNFWCDTEKEAEKIVKNDYLRTKSINQRKNAST